MQKKMKKRIKQKGTFAYRLPDHRYQNRALLYTTSVQGTRPALCSNDKEMIRKCGCIRKRDYRRSCRLDGGLTALCPGMGIAVTRSPTLNRSTSDPTSTISPAPSAPLSCFSLTAYHCSRKFDTLLTRDDDDTLSDGRAISPVDDLIIPSVQTDRVDFDEDFGRGSQSGLFDRLQGQTVRRALFIEFVLLHLV
jgi:hypothetical protein